MQRYIHNHLFKLVSLSLCIGLMGFALVSCDSNRFYEKNETIDNSVWFYKDVKVFEVEVEDSIMAYNFYINVRNTVDYEYANLYFFIHSELPNGVVAQDTVECQMADYEGKWLGDGRGKFRDNRFVLRQNMRFQHSGTYRFGLMHGMRTDSLKGIADVGIRLEIAE